MKQNPKEQYGKSRKTRNDGIMQEVKKMGVKWEKNPKNGVSIFSKKKECNKKLWGRYYNLIKITSNIFLTTWFTNLLLELIKVFENINFQIWVENI